MRALAEYLARTKTTQAAFAKQVGVSQPTIANLVNGVHSASTALLVRISKATGMTLDELLAEPASDASDVA